MLENQHKSVHFDKKSAQISTFLSRCIFWATARQVIIIIKVYDFTWIKLVYMQFQADYIL